MIKYLNHQYMYPTPYSEVSHFFYRNLCAQKGWMDKTPIGNIRTLYSVLCYKYMLEHVFGTCSLYIIIIIFRKLLSH